MSNSIECSSPLFRDRFHHRLSDVARGEVGPLLQLIQALRAAESELRLIPRVPLQTMTGPGRAAVLATICDIDALFEQQASMIADDFTRREYVAYIQSLRARMFLAAIDTLSADSNQSEATSNVNEK